MEPTLLSCKAIDRHVDGILVAFEVQPSARLAVGLQIGGDLRYVRDDTENNVVKQERGKE